jgi:hypothetical protein
MADIVGLTKDTELNPNLKPKKLLDPQLQDVADYLRIVEGLADDEITEANDAFRKIEHGKMVMDARIAAAKEIQGIWIHVATIVGSAIAVLVGLEVVTGGWQLFKWFKRSRKKAKTVSKLGGEYEVPLDGQVLLSKRRLHSREWKVSV